MLRPRHIFKTGHPLTKAQKREISLVRQEDVHYPHLTVREHLAFTALLRFQGPATVSPSHQTEVGIKPVNLETSTTADNVQRTITSLIRLLSMEKVSRYIGSITYIDNLTGIGHLICS